MSVVKWRRNGKGAQTVRCDGCGILSSAADEHFHYVRDGKSGYITSCGFGCEHDFCEQCAERFEDPFICPVCGHEHADADKLRSEATRTATQPAPKPQKEE